MCQKLSFFSFSPIEELSVSRLVMCHNVTIFLVPQCKTFSRGEGDRPRYKNFTTGPVNETALQEVLEMDRKQAALEFEDKFELREATKHIIPPDWETNAR
jgi:hypothetical protein